MVISIVFTAFCRATIYEFISARSMDVASVFFFPGGRAVILFFRGVVTEDGVLQIKRLPLVEYVLVGPSVSQGFSDRKAALLVVYTDCFHQYYH